MELKFLFNSLKNKKGLSQVVTVVILIAIVLSVTLVVWGFVKNMVEEEQDASESCFMVTNEKVGIDRDYTCYNSSSREIRFKISIGDIEIDSLLVSIEGEFSSEGFKILNKDSEVEGLYNYPSKTGNVVLPEKNSGITYVYELGDDFQTPITKLEIAPTINENSCSSSDLMIEISDCVSFV